ncbi:hypothetical protein AFI02nite_42570 [Aliivibrio fischeri]|uniref:Uncharacterized protein n=1 Tax=Aliivibrio fischeri TaxID=668 RepID=A0A510URX4_ALIFS|nr:hypothetical protein AFI02nite_42570 [Aliivibrio fischeri]
MRNTRQPEMPSVENRVDAFVMCTYSLIDGYYNIDSIGTKPYYSPYIH